MRLHCHGANSGGGGGFMYACDKRHKEKLNQWIATLKFTQIDFNFLLESIKPD